ncbi:MAG: GAF domain-containing protein [Anaerolineae bacterium]|nr:GAF domain-containing protein [Anaerolineae bacterium]MCO5195002.1 GAF domain-containing protein [Anaerolineae bacterium]
MVRRTSTVCYTAAMMAMTSDLSQIEQHQIRERLQTLYVVNDLLKHTEAGGLDIHVILPRVLQVAATELDAVDGSIIIASAERGVEHAWVIDAETALHPDYNTFIENVLDEGVAGVVLQSKTTVRIDDTSMSDLWLARPDEQGNNQPKSAICVPLVARGQGIGVLTLTKLGIGRFTDDDETMLSAIAGQAANTIENARLYEETQYQLKVTRLLNRASQVINSSLDLNEIIQSLLAQMNEIFQAHALSIALASPDRTELVYELAEGQGSDGIVGLRIPANQGISGWVLSNGEPVRVNNVDQDERFSTLGDMRSGVKTKAMIVAPLKVQDKVVGTIQVLNPRNQFFTEDDLELLVSLASLAGTAFANAQQFARTQAAEARYMSLFDDSIDPIILTDYDGIIVEVNRRASELLQYDSAELIGQSLDVLHQNSFAAVIESLRRLNGSFTERNKHIVITDRHAIARDGSRTPVEIHAKSAFMHDMRIMQWIYHDVSQQVELEAMRRDLTAMLYHDLQNPLTNILASLELLSMEMAGSLDPTVATMLDVATRSSRRLHHLIRSLLDINQLESGSPVAERHPIAVETVVNYVIGMMSPQFSRRKIKLVTNIADELPDMDVNADMVQRVLINLLDNAFKYSKRGQTVTLAVAQTSAYPDFVLMSVHDQGPGIAPRDREKVFEKFFRSSENPAKGIGLGLAYCRLAVEAHGGKIWVEDAPGSGSQFSLILPVYSTD